MVINGAARGAPWQLAKHLERTDHNERVHVMNIWGVDAPDLKSALYEMHCLGAGVRSRRTLYHANIDPRTDEPLTPQQWKRSVECLAKKLGFEDQPYVLVQHVKKGREHVHVVWSRIEIDAMKAIPDSHNYRKHEEVAQQLEQEFGHEHTRRVHIRDKSKENRPVPAPTFAEYLQAARSGIDPAKAKQQITECWRQTTTGHDFRYRLEAEGYLLARGDRKDFVLLDRAGEIHGLTGRRVVGVKAAEIRERMSDIDRDSLPDVTQVRRLLHERRQALEQEAALGFTSAADRLRAEELQREAEAKRHNRPKLQGADQEVADAIWQLNKTMRGQLDQIVVGLPTHEQRQEIIADLVKGIHLLPERATEAENRADGQPVKPESKLDAWMQQAGGVEYLDEDHLESARASYEKWCEAKEGRADSFSFDRYVAYVQGKEAERQREATAREVPAAEIEEQHAGGQVVPPAAEMPQSAPPEPPLPIPPAEPKTSHPEPSFLDHVFGWITGKRPEASPTPAHEPGPKPQELAARIVAEPSPEATQRASVEAENSRSALIPASERQNRPSASLFVKVFGWLIDAYQRAIERATVHELEKLEVRHDRQQPDVSAPSQLQSLAPMMPTLTAQPPRRQRRSLADEAIQAVAERTPEQVANERAAMERLREQEERERWEREFRLGD